MTVTSSRGGLWGVSPHQDVEGLLESALRPTEPQASDDAVTHPSHYTSVIPGIEVIEITKHLNFCRGNVIKYVLRAGAKGDGDQEIEDLRKARQYIDFEIERIREARTANA